MRKTSSGLAQAQLFLDEADKRLDSCNRRTASMNDRLGVLVGAAAIAGALATTAGTSGWVLTALIATALAALAGVLGWNPRKVGELPTEELRRELFERTAVHATLMLADWRIDLARKRERQVETKAWWLQVGLTLLAAAVVLLVRAALSKILGWQ